MRSRKLWAGIVAVFLISLLGMFAFLQNVRNHHRFVRKDRLGEQLSYEMIAPHVENYLIQNQIINNTNNTVTVPDTGDTNSVSEIAVEDAIKQLLDQGQLSYLTGASSSTGSRGPAGATGPQGPAGTDGSSVNTGAGMSVSGGVLSLQPCAIGQILLSDGTTWNCATVSSGGVSVNTTNTTASLMLTGTILRASVTDSDGNTVTSNPIDLGSTFITSATLSNYATTADLNTLTGRVSALENAGYATENWVVAQGYLTTTGLANYLSSNGYITNSTLATTLSNYLLKSDFANYLHNNLKAGAGISIGSDNTISSTVDTNIFIVTQNHLAETSPNPNRIYLDTSTNPISEWVYLNGLDGAPTDPTNPSAWMQIGEVNVDLSDYSTTAQMNTAISQALSNRLNDLANNSNLNSILSGYATTTSVQNAITTALNGYATQSWVQSQGYLTNASLNGYATQSWVNSQNYVNSATLTNNYYTSAQMNALLANKANQTALDSTNIQVASLQSAMAGKQDTLVAGNNITIAGNVISANIDLSNYATQSWVNSQGFLTSSALADYATQNWVQSQGYLTNASLAPYATQTWVQGQGYLTNSSLASYLNSNGYITNSDLASALGAYLLTSQFANTLNNNLKAGAGISISSDNTISSTLNTNIFTVTNNHLTETNPNPDTIYIDTSTNPPSQWVYLDGLNGAPTDPTNPNAWMQVGEVSIDLSQYSTTTQMNNAISQALTSSLNDLANNSNLSSILANYATQSWVQNQNYATQSWVQSQNYLTSSALTGLASQSWVNSQGYLTSSALAPYATQTWVQSQGYLTSATAAGTYVTQSSLASTLTGYQSIITGAATTITNNNLSTGMILQSDANGKVAVSSISFSALQTALNNITTLQSQVASNQTSITSLQTSLASLQNSRNYATSEVATGSTFNGKPVYRQMWNLSISQSANSENAAVLISTAGYTTGIVNAGGYWGSGSGSESFMISSYISPGGSYYGLVSVSPSGQLVFRSQSGSSRSSTPASVWVDYTKN